MPKPQRLATGTLLPPALATGLHTYVIEWELYPEQCKTALEQVDHVRTVEAAEQRRVDQATALQASDQRNASAEAHRFTFSKAFISGAVGAAIGAVITIWAESKKH